MGKSPADAASVRARSRSSVLVHQKAAVKTPSPNPFYKKAKKEHEKYYLESVLDEESGSRARTVSADKLKSESKSPTRRRAKSK